MPHTRFNRDATIEPLGEGTGKYRLRVGGPLEVDEASYGIPVTITFVIVQNPAGTPEGEHPEPDQTIRVRGVTQATVTKDNAAGFQWSAVAEFDEGTLRPAEARGVAVAVVENPRAFSYETLTWCDHLDLTAGTAAY